MPMGQGRRLLRRNVSGHWTPLLRRPARDPQCCGHRQGGSARCHRSRPATTTWATHADRSEERRARRKRRSRLISWLSDVLRQLPTEMTRIGSRVVSTPVSAPSRDRQQRPQPTVAADDKGMPSELLAFGRARGRRSRRRDGRHTDSEASRAIIVHLRRPASTARCTPA